LEQSTQRPRAGDPPKLDQPVEILKELLEIERNRLKVAVRIEEERKIVFPETSVIIHDIEKLVRAIYPDDCKTEKNNAVGKGSVGQSERAPAKIEGAF